MAMNNTQFNVDQIVDSRDISFDIVESFVIQNFYFINFHINTND